MTRFLSLKEAAECLRNGGIVGMPTETVYGLAAVATNEHAIAKIFDAKNRPTFDPLIVHIPDEEWIAKVAGNIPDEARRLATAFWPGPLTLILSKQPHIPFLVTAGLETVGVRLPSHALARQLIREVGLPLAAPSANLFGRTSPTTAEHVLDQLGSRIDGVVDGGPCDVGVESTIISFATQFPTLLRHGGICEEAIRDTLRTPLHVAVKGIPGTVINSSMQAPGSMESHYCPKTPLYFHDVHCIEDAFEQIRQATHKNLRAGLLCSGGIVPPDAPVITINLSRDGDLRQVATGLYGAMRLFDTHELDLIVAVGVIQEGLGRAINDRLRRADCTPKKR